MRRRLVRRGWLETGPKDVRSGESGDVALSWPPNPLERGEPMHLVRTVRSVLARVATRAVVARCIAPVASTLKRALGGTTVVVSICSITSGPSNCVPGGSRSRRYTGVMVKPVSGNQTLRVSASACTTLPPVAGGSGGGAGRAAVTSRRRLTTSTGCCVMA